MLRSFKAAHFRIAIFFMLYTFIFGYKLSKRIIGAEI